MEYALEHERPYGCEEAAAHELARALAFAGNSFLAPMSQTSDAGLGRTFWAAFPDFGSEEVTCALDGLFAWAAADEGTPRDERVRDVDLVITGEGNMDEQSAAGKAPVGVARRAKRYGKPVVAVVGGRADNLDAVCEQGIDLVLPICRKPMSLDQALNSQEATANLICAGEAAAQAYDLGRL